MKILSCIFFFLLLYHGQDLLAQTCCTAGVPIANSFSSFESNGRSAALQVNYDYQAINTTVLGDMSSFRSERDRYGQTVILRGHYLLSDRWGLSLALPFVHQTRETFSAKQSTFGVGDVSLLVQRWLLKNELNALNLSAGVKFPTGNVEHRDDSGIFLSPDMQSGSGSYDFMLQSSYRRYRFLNPNLNFHATAALRLNGANDDFASAGTFAGRGFSFGDDLRLSTGLAYSLLTSKGLFVVPDFSFSYRFGTANIEQDNDAPNSGGDWWSIFPGVSFAFQENRSIRLYGEIPIYQQLNGTQITTSFALGVQITYLLTKRKKNALQLNNTL